MKPRISARLFGRFTLHSADEELLTRVSGRAKEIFCYLAVNRWGAVPRDVLAGLISREAPPERSRKALRQSLWFLRSALAEANGVDARRVLEITDGWAQFRSEEVWLDVAEFERAAVRRTPLDPEAVPPPDPRRWAQAVELYRGELLQGWDQGWCIEERERLRQIYLETLDALVGSCEANQDVNAGVAYAVRALHTDPARECTHRALMRLYVRSGDRAAAARQYERCAEVLRNELRIEPDDETKALYRAIRSGHRLPPVLSEESEPLALRPRRPKI